jgi:nitrite reductase/ring-hydroxylating ferredoxin subunit
LRPGRAASPVSPLVERLEALKALDAPGKAVGKKVRGLVGPGALRDAISGTWLGHALHPVLTDVTIGAFVSASLVDVLGGRDGGPAAERLIGIGIVSYAPTALTGVSDWADSEAVDDRVRRVGVTHAATNSVALTLYAASLAARRAGRGGRGKALSLAGASVLAAGGYLGGHLSFFRGVGTNQTAFDKVPDDWTSVAVASDLEEGEPLAVVAGDAPVLLLRRPDGLRALHDRCSHRGCSLASGEIDGETVTCACHGSRFDLRDGSLRRGPATAPQPVYEVREREGRIELRPPRAR